MLYQKSFVKLNTKQAITMARMNPRGVLQGEYPRLIDEWQKAPDIWNQVKDDLDFNYEFGKYILTGSSTPADKTEVHHSGAGRIAPLNMRPMTLWESKESKGMVSLNDLFEGGENFPWDMNQDFTLEDVARTAADKMVRRHPHVFGAGRRAGEAEQKASWEEIKKAEKAFMEEETRKLQERFQKEKKELRAKFVAERKADYCMMAEAGLEA